MSLASQKESCKHEIIVIYETEKQLASKPYNAKRTILSVFKSVSIELR
jgi:hypothetical protein